MTSYTIFYLKMYGLVDTKFYQNYSYSYIPIYSNVV
jgi:hypothetical protein